MRRLAALLAVSVVLVPVLPVRAQEEGDVRLHLVSQTSPVTPDRPLRMRVRAVNDTSGPVRNLSISLWVFPAVRSRSEYNQALDVDVTAPRITRTFEFRGSIPPGGSRTFRLESGTAFLEDLGENALYPAKVQLQTEFVPIALVRTALVFIDERPKVPLNVATTFVLDAPLSLRPDGTFGEEALNEHGIDEGRAERIVTALERTPVPVTLAVSPVLLVQLARMREGYGALGGAVSVPPDDPRARAAADLLDRLRTLARSDTTEIVALPFASPSIPALVDAGLTEDLERHIVRGHGEVRRFLGVRPSERIFFPPGSALTSDALGALASMDVGALLVGHETLPPPAGLRLTPPPLTELSVRGGGSLAAIAPDPGVEQRVASTTDPPALRAHRTLGELSAIYFEEPSVDRGVAVLLEPGDPSEPLFLRRFLRGLSGGRAGVQWLRPMKASRLLEVETGPERALDRIREQFSPGFLTELRQVQDEAAQFGTMADGSVPALERVRTLLLLSQNRGLLNREDEAVAFVQAARDAVEAEYRKVEPPPANSVTTLTSQGGVIPVTIRSLLDYDIEVVVRLRSARLEFLEGAARRVVLSRPAQRFTFPVRAQTTGRFPVEVHVETPGGGTIAESSILVRSTAYNRVALVVTIGAALFLAALWARRFVPRRS